MLWVDVMQCDVWWTGDKQTETRS